MVGLLAVQRVVTRVGWRVLLKVEPMDETRVGRKAAWKGH